ncbi:MAG: hypothetical protein QW374_04985 [Candidatus Bathyarchaeia archaeon]|nr:hypothetical protein [Candidatus Bathyarchaeota archaeon]
MNDYTKGALEAITWAILVLKDSKDIREAIAELESARDSILRGIAVDFREKIKFYYSSNTVYRRRG